MAILSALVLIAVAVGVAVANDQPPALPQAPSFPINSLKRFPHHVLIETIPEPGSDSSVCGGTILEEQWILTSALCVKNANRLQLHFQRLSLSDGSGYTAIVNRGAIHVYPSVFEDIALVKIPFKLVFSSVLQKLALNTDDVSTLPNKMVVLPNFASVSGSTTPRLTYTMLSIAPSSACLEKNSDFDEYGQLCTTAYGIKAAAVCPTNVGSGLVVDWPASPKLVGIFTSSDNCQQGNPTIYTDISKYTSWMESVMATAV